MSVQEKDKVAALISARKATKYDSKDIKLILNGSDFELVKPFGTVNWPLTIPVLICTVVAFILFKGFVDLGAVNLNWNISFDVNIAVAAVIILAGILSILPKAIKNLQVLRSQNTIVSFVVLLAVAVFFLARILDLGTFIYTVAAINIGSVLGLVFVAAIVVLAFRGSKIAIVILVAMFLWWGFSIKGFGFSTFSDLFTSEDGGRLLRALTPPRWSYFSLAINPLIITIQTAVIATVIGIIGALPLSILAARNTSPHPVIYNVTRLIINTVRAIPALVLALLFIPFVGLGPAAGILGLGVHSISTLTKLFAESFESVKPQPIEALSAVGANGLKRFRWGVFPQAFPLIASYSIYSWESNSRDSTVVAFVGGGGIGFLLQANLALLDYANVSVLLIVLVLTVSLLDRFSDFIRSKII